MQALGWKVIAKDSSIYLPLLFVAASLLTCSCNPSHVSTGPRITSTAHLHTIGVALRDYKDEHGRLPERFSDLVPDYITSSNMAIFYITNELTKQQGVPSNWNVDSAVIDEHSSYVYLGTNDMHGIIAFEKTNLWKTTATHAHTVAALFSDFHVQDVSIAQLHIWLNQNKSK